MLVRTSTLSTLTIARLPLGPRTCRHALRGYTLCRRPLRTAIKSAINVEQLRKYGSPQKEEHSTRNSRHEARLLFDGRMYFIAAVGLGVVTLWTYQASLPISDYKLNFSTYVDYELVDVERVTSDASIFTLKGANETTAQLLSPLASISVRDPTSNIQRPYTVLDHDHGRMRLLVKRYPDGEVSRYLHSRKAGSTVSIRRVQEPFTMPSHLSKCVVLIAGGTGIAVALQLLSYVRQISHDQEHSIIVLHAIRNPGDDYLTSELEEASKGLQFQRHNFIDSEGRFLNKQAMLEYIPNTADVFVCGGEGFTSWITGIGKQGIRSKDSMSLLEQATHHGRIYALS